MLTFDQPVDCLLHRMVQASAKSTTDEKDFFSQRRPRHFPHLLPQRPIVRGQTCRPFLAWSPILSPSLQRQRIAQSRTWHEVARAFHGVGTHHFGTKPQRQHWSRPEGHCRERCNEAQATVKVGNAQDHRITGSGWDGCIPSANEIRHTFSCGVTKH